MSDELDLEKLRSIGIVGYPYGVPRTSPTEGDVKFNSAKEFDAYAKERNLVPVAPKQRASTKRVYHWDDTLRKWVER